MQVWKMTDHRKTGGGWKMQDWNLADQRAGLENAGPENAGLENAGQNVFLFFAVKLRVLYRVLIIVRASLSISIASEALMLWTCWLAYLCVCVFVCLSVYPESVLWQNG